MLRFRRVGNFNVSYAKHYNVDNPEELSYIDDFISELIKDILIDVALIVLGAAVIVFGIISTFAEPILYLKLLFS